jgi:ketosteroid isomerase-like protein
MNLQRLESELNDTVAKGQILEALSEFYADDCTFVEGDGSRRESKKAQHEHLSAFFATLKGFNGATLHGQSTGDDVSMSEWTFDMVGPDEESIVWNEVLVRRWRDGKVVSERFYQAG